MNPRQGIETPVVQVGLKFWPTYGRKTVNPRQGIETDEPNTPLVQRFMYYGRKTVNPRQGIETNFRGEAYFRRLNISVGRQ